MNIKEIFEKHSQVLKGKHEALEYAKNLRRQAELLESAANPAPKLDFKAAAKKKGDALDRIANAMRASKAADQAALLSDNGWKKALGNPETGDVYTNPAYPTIKLILDGNGSYYAKRHDTTIQSKSTLDTLPAFLNKLKNTNPKL